MRRMMRMKRGVWCDVFSMQPARGLSRGRRTPGAAPWASAWGGRALTGPGKRRKRRRRRSVVGGRPLWTTRRW